MYRKDYPANGAVALDALKSDTVNLTAEVRAVFVSVDGDIKVTMMDDSVATFANVVAGTIYPLRIKRLWSNGTTATGLIGLT